MSMIPDTTRPSDCPSWCTGQEYGHEPTTPVRRHEGDLVAVSALADGGSSETLAEVSLERYDEDGRPGEPVVTLVGLELTPDGARSLALSLLALADTAGRAPRGGGVPRFRGRPVLPRGLHDVQCAWRIASRDDERPDLAWCASCGSAVEIGAPAVGR